MSEKIQGLGNSNVEDIKDRFRAQAKIDKPTESKGEGLIKQGFTTRSLMQGGTMLVTSDTEIAQAERDVAKIAVAAISGKVDLSALFKIINKSDINIDAVMKNLLIKGENEAFDILKIALTNLSSFSPQLKEKFHFSPTTLIAQKLSAGYSSETAKGFAQNELFHFNNQRKFKYDKTDLFKISIEASLELSKQELYLA